MAVVRTGGAHKHQAGIRRLSLQRCSPTRSVKRLGTAAVRQLGGLHAGGIIRIVLSAQWFIRPAGLTWRCGYFRYSGMGRAASAAALSASARGFFAPPPWIMEGAVPPWHVQSTSGW